MEELKEKIAPFVNDPNWVFVENIFQKHIASMLTFLDIDLSQDAPDVKGEMLARKKVAEVIKKALSELASYKHQEPVKYPTFR